MQQDIRRLGSPSGHLLPVSCTVLLRMFGDLNIGDALF
jgi:hypothetical protein